VIYGLEDVKNMLADKETIDVSFVQLENYVMNFQNTILSYQCTKIGSNKMENYTTSLQFVLCRYNTKNINNWL
jgi:hypothetical protein